MNLFITVLILVILQRLLELVIAKRNTEKLLARGAVEFGANHYWVIVLLHTCFFISLIAEFRVRGAQALFIPKEVFAFVFLCAQALRVWVLLSMKGRWTTRIIALKGDSLVRTGPFRFLRHPNYTIVAVELLTLPLYFGLTYTAVAFTVLNAAVLLGIRIPEEEKSFKWANTVGD